MSELAKILKKTKRGELEWKQSSISIYTTKKDGAELSLQRVKSFRGNEDTIIIQVTENKKVVFKRILVETDYDFAVACDLFKLVSTERTSLSIFAE